MRKIVILLISMLLLFPSLVFANTISKTSTDVIALNYSFNLPRINTINIDGQLYHEIIVDNASCFGNPEEPCLPIKSAYLLLPYHTKIDKIMVEPQEKTSLGTGYNILPVSKPIPISMLKQIEPPSKNLDIYNSDSLFPGKLYDKIGVYSFRGYQILVLSLYPVQYEPTSGEVFYYSNLKIKIQTVEDTTINTYYNGLTSDKLEVMKKVDNPSIADTYPISNTVFSDRYDMLIITVDEFKDAFEPLKQAHDPRGVSTRIKTLRDINILPNTVTAEDIRDFIRAEYTTYNIEYVLLGGDWNFVPAKMLFVSGMDEDQWYYETLMPSDLYYACLDGPYNYDGDSNWGEPNDGEDGGDVDLIAEVYVGRACVDSVEEVHNFVNKTINYLNTDCNDQYLRKVLMAGEHLGDYGVASWGGNYLDLLIDECNADAYTTVGIPSDSFEIEKVYDRDWEDNSWAPEDLLERINDNNVHILNHDGHSNYVYNMKMSIWDIDQFTNDKPFFDYSQGCMCGGFDDPQGNDCFAEYLTVKTSKGAFAVIMNARYGWFWAYSTDGDGTRFKRQFWDAVFAENIPVISKANQDSKEDNLNLITRSCMRWTYYQLNLFGDPSVAFKITTPPEKPSKPLGETSITAGEAYSYSSSTTDLDGDQVYYLWDWDDGSTSIWFGPYNSGQTVEATHSWSTKGTYAIKVKAKDSNGEEGPWSDPLSVKLPYIVKPIWQQFFERLFERFPHAFPFLRHIMRYY